MKLRDEHDEVESEVLKLQNWRQIHPARALSAWSSPTLMNRDVDFTPYLAKHLLLLISTSGDSILDVNAITGGERTLLVVHFAVDPPNR